jgi:hypothetical protein
VHEIYGSTQQQILKVRFASHELAYLPNLTIRYPSTDPAKLVFHILQFEIPRVDRVELRFEISWPCTPFPSLFAATMCCCFHVFILYHFWFQSCKTKQGSNENAEEVLTENQCMINNHRNDPLRPQQLCDGRQREY